MQMSFGTNTEVIFYVKAHHHCLKSRYVSVIRRTDRSLSSRSASTKLILVFLSNISCIFKLSLVAKKKGKVHQPGAEETLLSEICLSGALRVFSVYVHIFINIYLSHINSTLHIVIKEIKLIIMPQKYISLLKKENKKDMPNSSWFLLPYGVQSHEMQSNSVQAVDVYHHSELF